MAQVVSKLWSVVYLAATRDPVPWSCYVIVYMSPEVCVFAGKQDSFSYFPPPSSIWPRDAWVNESAE